MCTNVNNRHDEYSWEKWIKEIEDHLTNFHHTPTSTPIKYWSEIKGHFWSKVQLTENLRALVMIRPNKRLKTWNFDKIALSKIKQPLYEL